MSKSVKKKSTKYREGTINGIRTSNRKTKQQRQQEEYNSLIKMLCCCVCVLIMVFVLNSVVRSNFTYDGLSYVEPEESEVVEIVSSSSDEEPAERVNLHLNGDLIINLKVGDKFVEPGFEATSDLKGDISSYVKVDGKVNTDKVGTYKLTYTLEYRGISPKLTRLVKVSKSGNTSTSSGEVKEPEVSATPSATPSESPTPSSSPSPSVSPTPSPIPGPSPSPTPSCNVNLKMNGDETVYVIEGSSYTDAGAVATDCNGKNISNQISVEGSVDTNKPGTYKIIYSISNYDGNVLSTVRNVVVQSMGITLTLDNKEYTNKSVNIIITANVDNFSNIVLPSGEKVTENTYSYNVTKNGTYEFIVYNKTGDYRKASMIVENIDKEKPKGKCSITTTENSTVITVNATDNVGIDRYTYSGREYTEEQITISNKLSSGIQINVGFYDKAGNFGNANCLVP